MTLISSAFLVSALVLVLAAPSLPRRRPVPVRATRARRNPAG